MTRKLLFPFLLLPLFVPIPTARAQESTQERYVYPTDPLVVRKLDEWQDRKFGLLMHWGLYAQLGIVESWALCSEDQSFTDLSLSGINPPFALAVLRHANKVAVQMPSSRETVATEQLFRGNSFLRTDSLRSGAYFIIHSLSPTVYWRRNYCGQLA